MSPEIISILALVACFVVATTISVNMGVVAFTAAFLVGRFVAGFDDETIFAGFPGDIFLVLVGVTYLFAIARANGTTDWLVSWSVRLVGGRVAAVPWVMFGVAAVLTAIGAASPAACAIIAPIALNFAFKHGINPLLMGAMVVHGTQAGGFSPISVFGVIVNGVVEGNDLPGSPLLLFVSSLVLNLAIAVFAYVAFGGMRLLRAERPAAALSGGGSAGGGGAGGDAPGAATRTGSGEQAAGELEELPLTLERLGTLLGLAVLVIGTLVFGLDVGFAAITVGLVLTLLWPRSAKNAPSEVNWSTVLLICGVLTYVGVLQEMGTIDYTGQAVAAIGLPLVGALLLCYIGGIVSAFASSTGIMGALIPLAIPFLEQGAVAPIGMVVALALASTVVDVSPFSTNGAIVLANAKGVDRDRFFRQLLIYGATITALGPALVWLVFVVPGLV
ncbi:SLC13 family permease [Salinifilum aidingensis]